ncbi:MAG: exo-alpha-sialidase [Kiritimatiellae bacterium]|nr:exo-alpha-sialidase [Kiritimatiellia bacterium]MBQ3341926.1 exo-alpha-sialidase [Kiritimatiellia bacterium]
MTVLHALVLLTAAVCRASELPSGDIVVYKPEREKRTEHEVGCDYNDHFHVLWDAGRRAYYAFWTQGSWEGAGDHHVVFSKSTDRGKSWTPPRILAGSEVRSTRKFDASWQQPMLAKSGRLYVLWNQKIRRAWPNEVLCGFYSDDGGETWSAPDLAPAPRSSISPHVTFPDPWINWQRPLRLGRDGRYFAPSSRDDATVEFWVFDNLDENPEISSLRITLAMADGKAIGVRDMAEKAVYTPREGLPTLEEASVVKLPDGRLFALMRSTTGHPVWTVSSDLGAHWTAPRFLRDHDGGRPFLHPRSPCPIYDWRGPEAGSGRYLAFVHGTFDFGDTKSAWQNRGPVYLIAGRFVPGAEQPIAFSRPRLFLDRKRGNAFYTSYTVADGVGILWYPDCKHDLRGRVIGPEWMDEP